MTERQTERDRHRQRDRQTNKLRGRQRYRRTEITGDRKKETQKSDNLTRSWNKISQVLVARRKTRGMFSHKHWTYKMKLICCRT